MTIDYSSALTILGWQRRRRLHRQRHCDLCCVIGRVRYPSHHHPTPSAKSQPGQEITNVLSPQLTRHLHRLYPSGQLSRPLRSAPHTVHPAIRRSSCWSLEPPFSSLIPRRAYQVKRGLRKVVRSHYDVCSDTDVSRHACRMWDAVV